MADRKVYTFLDPQPLARTVVVWIWIYFAAVVLSGLSALIVVDRSARGGALEEDLLITSLPALLYLLTFAVSGFLILKWIYRVSRNAHSFAEGLQVSPPWAVGWYFVPIAYLWKPFQAMRETWQASAQPDSWKDVPVPARLRWWWGLWLVSNLLGQISGRLATAVDPSIAAMVDIASSLVDAPLCIILIGIVRDLTQLQTVEASHRAAPAVAA